MTDILEKQKRAPQAIIYIGGGAPKKAIVDRYIAKDHYVVCADSGLHAAMEHGRAIDALIGDLDSVHLHNEAARAALVTIRYPHDKDQSDSELAIAYCRKRGCSSMLLVGGGGGRFDHLLGILWLFEGARPVNMWIHDSAIVEFTNRRWSRTHVDIGEIISVFPIKRGPWKLRSNGLRWPLQNTHWKRGNFGLSNEAVASTVSIDVVRGAVLIIYRTS